MVTPWAEATCTWITVFRFLSRLLTSTLNHQTKPTALFTTAVGLLKGVNMRYCTRVIWHKIHTHRRTHCVRHEQNATLSDCWQTDAVRGCRSLTHGWHQACLNFTVSSEAGWLSLSSRDSNSCLSRPLLTLWYKVDPCRPGGEALHSETWGSSDGW